MAITRETKVSMSANQIPEGWSTPAQTYVPSSSAIRIPQRTFFLPASGVAHATEQDTGFDAMLVAADTYFGSNELPDLGIDSAETINLLFIVEYAKRGIDTADTEKTQYLTGVDGWEIRYRAYWEETP